MTEVKTETKPKPIMTRYSAAVRKEILSRLYQGQSINSICRDPKMPGKQTLYDWLHKYSDFKKQFDEAKIQGLLAYADEMIDIADDATNDFMEVIDKHGKTYVKGDHEMVQRSKLRIEARQWMLTKMVPKIFGNKVEVSAGGELATALKEARERATNRNS